MFPSILSRTRGTNYSKIGIQVYHDHIQNWFWSRFDNFPTFGAEWIEFGGSRNFLENAWKGWPENRERRHIFDFCTGSCQVCHWFYGSQWELCQHCCLVLNHRSTGCVPHSYLVGVATACRQRNGCSMVNAMTRSSAGMALCNRISRPFSQIWLCFNYLHIISIRK